MYELFLFYFFLGSVRTLSDKYQKPIDAIDDGLISHVSSLPTASGSKGGKSEKECIPET